MRPATLTLTATGSTRALPLDWRADCFKVGFGAAVTTTGTVVYKVQHTFTNLLTTVATDCVWFDHDTVTAATGNVDGNYAFPVSGVRITATQVTAGSTIAVTFYTAG